MCCQKPLYFCEALKTEGLRLCIMATERFANKQQKFAE